ncbi:MAG TPA: hypothetical protein VED18_08705 [Candidatus Sulfotelmatobacter sp.]|nr:hypothetical protein [Candidatus Sulfotelmatobacter sp.]
MSRLLKITAWSGFILVLAAVPVLAQTAPPAAQQPTTTAQAQAAPAAGASGGSESDTSGATPAACLPWSYYPYGTRPYLSQCPEGRLYPYESGPSPLAPSPSSASGSFGSGWFSPR